MDDNIVGRQENTFSDGEKNATQSTPPVQEKQQASVDNAPQEAAVFAHKLQEQEAEKQAPLSQTAARPQEEKPATPPASGQIQQQNLQQQVHSFYAAQQPVQQPVQQATQQPVQQTAQQNGCTYAYGRLSEPQAPHANPHNANPYNASVPPQQPYSRPAAPQQPHGNYNAPPQSAQAQNGANRQQNTAGNPRAAVPPKAKKAKKEKKPRNRMSFGQFFLCVALCLVVGSAAGYVSSKTTVEKLLTEFSSKQAEMTTTGSYNVNIYEQPAPTTPPTEAVPQTTPVVADKTTASEIYKANVNTVVNITATGHQTVSFGFFFGNQTQEFTSSGSGFFLTEDGYILTNYHVVEGAEKITVTDYEGDEYAATLIGFEESNDIAVLKVSGSFHAVDLGDSAQLEVGDTLLIIGNALGELQYTLTQGVVSFLERSVTTDTGTVINMFQTDAAINSGNSGGPVFNGEGKVVGIASAKYASSSIEGLGFCIPIDDVKQMISDIIDVGYVTGKPLLGVSLFTNTSRSNGLPYGCYIVAVGEGSAAAAAGLSEGDVITAVGGNSVRDVDDFGTAINNFKAGDSITLTVYDGAVGTSSQISVVLGEYKPASPRTEYSNVYDF